MSVRESLGIRAYASKTARLEIRVLIVTGDHLAVSNKLRSYSELLLTVLLEVNSIEFS